MVRGQGAIHERPGYHPQGLQGFVDNLLKTRKPATAHNRFRALKTFFGWLENEGEIDESPMRKLSPPEVPEVPVEPITEDEMRALIKVCQRSRDFAHKRDEAIIRLFYDTGIRRKELANLREEDINRDLGVVLVLGKGRRPRSAPFGKQTALALSRRSKGCSSRSGASVSDAQ